MKFEDFIREKGDNIDNAAYNLLCLLATKEREVSETEPEPVDWNMELIGDLVDYAEYLLKYKNIMVCRPFYEGDESTPCYKGTDCKRKDCIFRSHNEYGEAQKWTAKRK